MTLRYQVGKLDISTISPRAENRASASHCQGEMCIGKVNRIQ
jgi:hypothetical protein